MRNDPPVFLCLAAGQLHVRRESQDRDPDTAGDHPTETHAREETEGQQHSHSELGRNNSVATM